MKQLVRTNILLSLAVCSLWAQAPGRIQGKVTDDAGQAVANVYVVAAPTTTGARNHYTAATSATGDFSLDQVPAGAYKLCVQAPRTAYLDPCLWSTPAQLALTAGQVATNTNLQVSKGSILRVRVDDPGQHLARGEGMVLLGFVVPSGRFQPLVLGTNDPSGRTYEAAIPFDKSLRLELTSNGIQLNDEGNRALTNGQAAVALQQAPGQADRTVTFHITGKK